jgi:hypothetical protein
VHRFRSFKITQDMVAFSYVQRIAAEWFRDGGHPLKEHENQ